MQLGMTEMIFIFLLALVIFGPKKLPEIGRQLGKAMNEFKRASNEFRSQLEDEIRQIDATEQAKKLAAPAESTDPAERLAGGELTIAPPPEAIAHGGLPEDEAAREESIAAAASSNGNAHEIAPPTTALTQEFNG
jgi:sec-independent protein translocase protein TatB